MAAHLQQRVVGAAQHSLGLSERVDLPTARLLPCIEILDEPIAFGMELGEVLVRCHERLGRAGAVALGRLQVALQICLLGGLGRQRLRIVHPLVLRVRDRLVIVRLRVLLLRLGLGHLAVEIFDQQIEHGNDAAALFRLLRVCAPGLRRRCGSDGAVRVLGHLNQRRRAGHVTLDGALGGQLDLCRRVVELGVVKLVEPILGEQEQLLRGPVCSHQRLVLLGLLFAQRRRLRDALVEGRDAGLQR
mmetsp:Transcript_83085/g.222915  ORF Transcript_83085/g.222915 Transcript_83085/m.222915 type:complete len:245 (+) Transcript_83085:129-863(+)